MRFVVCFLMVASLLPISSLSYGGLFYEHGNATGKRIILTGIPHSYYPHHWQLRVGSYEFGDKISSVSLNSSECALVTEHANLTGNWFVLGEGLTTFQAGHHMNDQISAVYMYPKYTTTCAIEKKYSDFL